MRALALLPLVREGAAVSPWVERATRVPVRRLVDEAVQMRVDGQATGTDRLIEFWGPASVVSTLDLASEVIEGDPANHRTILIEFPSREVFRAWYDSPAYRNVLQLRLDSVPGEFVVAQGFVPPKS